MSYLHLNNFTPLVTEEKLLLLAVVYWPSLIKTNMLHFIGKVRIVSGNVFFFSLP